MHLPVSYLPGKCLTYQYQDLFRLRCDRTKDHAIRRHAANASTPPTRAPPAPCPPLVHPKGPPPRVRCLHGHTCRTCVAEIECRRALPSPHPISPSPLPVLLASVVPRPRGAAPLDELQLAHRHLRVRVHHGRAVYPPAAIPGQQRGRPDLQDLLGHGVAHPADVARRDPPRTADELPFPPVCPHAAQQHYCQRQRGGVPAYRRPSQV